MILTKSNPFAGASFKLRNRIARALWKLIWLFFFRLSPPNFHQWRCWILRRFGARIGKNCHIYSDVVIWAPWNLSMANNSCLGHRVICYSMDLVHLCEEAIVSQGVHLCTGSHDYETESFQLFTKPIFIGAKAWICADAFLAPGVHIGDGAVIGARSVVTRDQPSWMVCAGNPCKPIKVRSKV